MSDTTEYKPLRALSELLGVSLPTARKLVRSGQVPAVRAGRNFRISENTLSKVDDILRAQREGETK